MATYFVSLYATSDITFGSDLGGVLTATVNIGATPILVEINDSDAGAGGTLFSDSSVNQTVVSSSNGNLFAGQPISPDVSLASSTDPADKVFIISFGAPILANFYGFTFTPVPGVPGSFGGGFDGDPDILAGDLYAHCFTRGTAIRTERGETLVEDLVIGDSVWTESNGMQPVRWICRREVPAIGAFAPVRIRKGALGAVRDIVVSPAHRMLVQGPEIEMLFGMPKALVAAKDLLNDSTITREASLETVEYFHILFDQHEVLEAHGTLSESFYPHGAALDDFGAEQRRELFALFPELETGNLQYEVAYPSLQSHEISLIVR